MRSNFVTKVLESIDKERVVRLASKLIGFHSNTYEGQAEMAEYCVAYMEGMGLEAELQDVPLGNGMKSKQALGRARGSGDGLSLIFCSHIEGGGPPCNPELWTKKEGEVDDGWLYGLGGQKTGMAAMMVAAGAVNKILDLKGDIIVACVVGEQAGGIGIRHMLDQGITADMGVVAEDSDLELVTISVSGIFGRLHVHGTDMWARPDGRIHSIEKMHKIINAIGSFETIPSWLTFKPHPDLPGYPLFNILSIQGRGDSCTAFFDCRIVPGQTEETIRRDLEKLLEKLRAEDPDLKVELEMPPPGCINRLPFEISHEERIVQTVAKWHEYVTKRKPVIGAGCRLGFASDAINLMHEGVKCLNYGPGGHPVPPPVADRRYSVEDIFAAAKVYGLTAADICT
jgi:acetylornithine deacetylase